MPNIRTLREQAESAIETVSIQVADQVDQILRQMETVSNIIQINRTYRSLLDFENIDYIAQIRNYWILSQSLQNINSYFYNLDLRIHLYNESLLTHERIHFHGIGDIIDAQWLDEVILRNGGIVWVTDYDDVPIISAVRMMDSNILSISIPQSEIMHILSLVASNIHVSISIEDTGDVLLFAGESMEESSDKISFIHPLTVNNWQIVIATPTANFEREIRNTQLLFSGGILLLFLFFLFVTLTLIRDAVETEKRKKQLEFQALQAQIKPHFVYNALDAISWLALDSDNRKISDALVNLATLLRKNFTLGDDIVTIKDEMEHAGLYVEAIKYRTDCVINLHLNIDENMLSNRAVKFTFQPIIENSIHHGFLKEKHSSGLIEVEGRFIDGYNIISIKDDGAGFDCNETSKNEDANHFGLNSVIERLKLHFGEDSSMTFDSKIGHGTCVSLKWK